MTMIITILLIVAVMAVQWMVWQRWFKQEGSSSLAAFSTVRGITLCEACSYHPNHSWVRVEDENTAVIGLDDFARRLIGPAVKVILPMQGSYIQAGESCVKLIGRGREVSLLAPVSGEVESVNQELIYQPALASTEPYGRGWLYRLRGWHLADQKKDLFSGIAAREWMSGSINKLIGNLDSAVGAVSQDGGYVAEDLSEAIATQDWIQIVRKHLATEPIVR